MALSNSSGNKRRRTATMTSFTDLPHGCIVSVAEYLPKTSCALFAVALSGPSKSVCLMGWNNLSDASKSIITNCKQSKYSPGPDILFPRRIERRYRNLHLEEYKKRTEEYYGVPCYEVLDFIDIGRLAAEKLTDDDIGAVLVCIDAKNKLKTLRLDICCKVVGGGLEPLRGSTVLEHIRFCAPRKKGQYQQIQLDWGKSEDEFSFSPVAVVPILDSIISAAGDSLRNINLPLRWRKGDARNDSPLKEFLERFNELQTGEEKCDECKADESVDNMVHACFTCSKRICEGCSWHQPLYRIRHCANCDLSLCNDCENNFSICSGCEEAYCSICARDEDVNVAVCCDGRPGDYCEPRCFGCATSCENCLGRHYPILDKMNDELREENDELLEENGKLRKEIDELRKQMASGLGILE